MTNTTTTPAATTTSTGPAPDTAGDAVDLEAVVDLHLQAYAEPDAARRAELVAAAWTPDGELLDPPLEGRGHAELAALTDSVLAHFPGHTFRRTSAVDAHHDRARYGWDLVAPDGSVTLSGVDVAEFSGAKLRRVVGFFGPLPDRS